MTRNKTKIKYDEYLLDLFVNIKTMKITLSEHLVLKKGSTHFPKFLKEKMYLIPSTDTHCGYTFIPSFNENKICDVVDDFARYMSEYNRKREQQHKSSTKDIDLSKKIPMNDIIEQVSDILILAQKYEVDPSKHKDFVKDVVSLLKK